MDHDTRTYIILLIQYQATPQNDKYCVANQTTPYNLTRCSQCMMSPKCKHFHLFSNQFIDLRWYIVIIFFKDCLRVMVNKYVYLCDPPINKTSPSLTTITHHTFSVSTTPPSSKYHTTSSKYRTPSSKYHTTLFKVPQPIFKVPHHPLQSTTHRLQSTTHPLQNTTHLFSKSQNTIECSSHHKNFAIIDSNQTTVTCPSCHSCNFISVNINFKNMIDQ